MDKYVVAPPSGSTNNSVGAVDRPWTKGYFDELPGWQEYLAESTGYGIVSGCEPSISDLTVTVAAGVVHLAGGTRKEISATNITLDPADSTNPRIDLVYIDSKGAVVKITGTAAANPSAPSVPTNGISVCTVSVAANAVTGTLNHVQTILPSLGGDIVDVRFYGAVGDGVTDDTAAIQAALDAGNLIKFSQGVYKVTDKLNVRSNKDINLNGATIYYTFGHECFYIQEEENINIYNGTIKGIGTVSSDDNSGMIKINGGVNVTVHDIIGVEGNCDGIYLVREYNNQHNENIFIYNCYIQAARNAIAITDGSNVVVDSCYLRDCVQLAPMCGIDIEMNYETDKCENIIISNITTKGNGLGSILTQTRHITSAADVHISNVISIGDGCVARDTGVFFIETDKSGSYSHGLHEIYLSNIVIRNPQTWFAIIHSDINSKIFMDINYQGDLTDNQYRTLSIKPNNDNKSAKNIYIDFKAMNSHPSSNSANSLVVDFLDDGIYENIIINNDDDTTVSLYKHSSTFTNLRYNNQFSGSITEIVNSYVKITQSSCVRNGSIVEVKLVLQVLDNTGNGFYFGTLPFIPREDFILTCVGYSNEYNTARVDAFSSSGGLYMNKIPAGADWIALHGVYMCQ